METLSKTQLFNLIFTTREFDCFVVNASEDLTRYEAIDVVLKSGKSQFKVNKELTCLMISF